MKLDINWDDLRQTQLAEIKALLNTMIELIENVNDFVKSEGFDSVLKEELLTLKFAIYTANFSRTIELGKRLEKIYYQSLSDFSHQLKA